MSKYFPLKEFLGLHREKEVTLRLRQIEIIINDTLPESARSYYAWWYGPFHHPHVKSWSDTGWSVEVHAEEGTIEWVTFRKR